MTERKPRSRTDWAKVDAHKLTRGDYEEMPEWTDDQLDRAELKRGGKIVRPANGTLTKRGRPKLAAPKKSVHLRLSQDVLAHFRKGGPGWQTRIDETLRKATKLDTKKSATPRR
jgi:uncharacterized protein (DUF4415 family)